MAVPQVVESHTREVCNARYKAAELMSEASRLQRLAIGLSANQRLAVLTDAK
jgi:hypothetical protein